MCVLVLRQFAELFIGQRGSYLEKEVSLLRTRLIEALQSVSGEVGLTSQEKKPKGLPKLNRAAVDNNRAAWKPPALRIEKVRAPGLYPVGGCLNHEADVCARCVYPTDRVVRGDVTRLAEEGGEPRFGL
jgi:hypothetical protein